MDDTSWPGGVEPGELGGLCEFDRVSAAESGLAGGRSFEADYLLAGRPVSMAGAAESIAAYTTWTRGGFFGRVGGEVFSPQVWNPQQHVNEKAGFLALKTPCLSSLTQKLPMWRDKLIGGERLRSSPSSVLPAAARSFCPHVPRNPKSGQQLTQNTTLRPVS